MTEGQKATLTEMLFNIVSADGTAIGNPALRELFLKLGAGSLGLRRSAW